MTKLKVLGASVAMALLIASPAAADTTVQFGGASVENEFLFFDDGVFNNGDNGFFD
jgi:hypothetical protein